MQMNETSAARTEIRVLIRRPNSNFCLDNCINLPLYSI